MRYSSQPHRAANAEGARAAVVTDHAVGARQARYRRCRVSKQALGLGGPVPDAPLGVSDDDRGARHELREGAKGSFYAVAPQPGFKFHVMFHECSTVFQVWNITKRKRGAIRICARQRGETRLVALARFLPRGRRNSSVALPIPEASHEPLPARLSVCSVGRVCAVCAPARVCGGARSGCGAFCSGSGRRTRCCRAGRTCRAGRDGAQRRCRDAQGRSGSRRGSAARRCAQPRGVRGGARDRREEHPPSAKSRRGSPSLAPRTKTST